MFRDLNEDLLSVEFSRITLGTIAYWNDTSLSGAIVKTMNVY